MYGCVEGDYKYVGVDVSVHAYKYAWVGMYKRSLLYVDVCNCMRVCAHPMVIDF